MGRPVNGWLRFCSTSGLVVVLAASAAAQRPPAPGQRPGGPPPGMGRGPGGGFGGPGGGQRGRREISAVTLPVDALNRAVNLTAAQKTKVTKIQAGLRTQMRSLFPGPGGPGQPARAGGPPPGRPGGPGGPGMRFDPAVFQKIADARAKANTEVMAVLTGPQKAKLQAALGEMRTYRLAGIPLGMYGLIKLTPAQKTQLQTIQKSLPTMQPGGNFQAMMGAMQGARQKAEAVLTPGQKTQIEKYMAAHPEERGFGGRGRGGPGMGGPGMGRPGMGGPPGGGPPRGPRPGGR